MLPKLANSIREQFEDRLIQVLIIAAIISTITGMMEFGPELGWTTGVSIALVTFLIIVIASSNDHMKDKQFLEL